MRTMIWVAGLVALLAGPASAQLGSGVFGGGAGAAVTVGRLGEDFNDGGFYAAWMGMGLHDHVDLIARFHQSFHDQKREDDALFGDSDLTMTTVTLGPKLYLTPSWMVARPFVAGEMGYSRVELNDAGQNVLQDSNRYALSVGGGLEFGRPGWGIGFDVRYYRSVGPGPDLGWVAPMASFTWRVLP